ncbi:MAG: aspartate aminotransferase family protein [Clostridiaceae bacterium]|jgi:glutamate/tyrosine decarboxylase-like PLP-dependent enzyme|nr:aspartate aminotransferase family protein [Clostridiaceae bacterium]
MNFPQKGISEAEVFRRMEEYKADDGKWKDGRTFSLVYYAGEEITALTERAYREFFHTNALNPFVFNSLKRFETEIISMTANLFHGDADTVGSLTSGGSESLLMAIKTYRDEARRLKPHIKEPEMILPITAHASLEKAAHYFGVKVVHVPTDKDYKADIKAVEAAINDNTILILGSAPQYPQGIIDPIAELGALALKYGVRLHVDACLGGFTLPFLKEAGVDIPPFDFAVPGVTSLSADLHKYAFAAKGVSVLLYKNKDIRRFQYFSYADWPGGLFISPSATGTRPGGAIASAWAVLNFVGKEGYIKIHKKIKDLTERFLDRIRSFPELYILGDPKAGIFAFGSNTLNVHALADILEHSGWVIDQQSNPDCLHFMITPAHENVIEPFIFDLKTAIALLKASPEKYVGGSAALYGMSAAIPDKVQVNEYILEIYNNFMTLGGKFNLG